MCLAQDAHGGESSSPSGPEKPRPELPLPSAAALERAAEAMLAQARQTGELVTAIRSLVETNSKLLAALADVAAGGEEDLEVPVTFLSGKPR